MCKNGSIWNTEDIVNTKHLNDIKNTQITISVFEIQKYLGI